MSWIKNEQPSHGFPGGSDGKESACNAGDPGSLPGSGESLRKWNGNPLQRSFLENSIDREAWWVRVHGVTKSRTCLRTNTSIFPWPWELWISSFPWPQWSGPFFLSFLYISSTLLVTLSISEHFLWSWAARCLRTSAENSSQLKPSADRHWQCCCELYWGLKLEIPSCPSLQLSYRVTVWAASAGLCLSFFTSKHWRLISGMHSVCNSSTEPWRIGVGTFPAGHTHQDLKVGQERG